MDITPTKWHDNRIEKPEKPGLYAVKWLDGEKDEMNYTKAGWNTYESEDGCISTAFKVEDKAVKAWAEIPGRGLKCQ